MNEWKIERIQRGSGRKKKMKWKIIKTMWVYL